MKQKTYDKIEKYTLIIFASMLLILFFIGITIRNIEQGKERVKEFDLKYKPVCDSLGGIYKQEGNYRNNVCYLNDNGILRKSYMNKINGEWHLTDV